MSQASRVRVLPNDLVNQIAAGEVVERPASVVKELVENALDAEATRIEVSIHEGGVRGLSVVDDGIGMSPADAALAFERHATSKIRSADDLLAVGTLGFRGEALPSIASVAEVRVCTRPEGEALGTAVRVVDGRVVCESWSGPAGTRVEVAELFGRVPARRKFLKTAATEAGHVTRWLERMALARPDVRFALVRDGRPIATWLPSRDPRERVIAVLPAGLGERLLPVRGTGASGEVVGWSSPTDLMRGQTSDIHLYVNGRPVRDPLLLHGVREAYRDALPPGRHPVAVLFLRIDPADVDVNVHPAKSEVRFRDPWGTRRLLRDALQTAIGLRAAPAAATDEAWTVRETAGPGRSPPAFDPDRGSAPLDPGAQFRLGAPFPPPPLAAGRPAVAFAAHRYLGQVLGTYLVLERDGVLVLMDQHAAHERVLFERMREGLLQGKLERQALLIPLWTSLPRSAADALEQSVDDFMRAGIELEIGGPTADGRVRVAVRSVPAVLARRDRDWTALLAESASRRSEPEGSETRDGLDAAMHDLLATAACHAAVRKGDRLDPREVQGLLEALDEVLWVPNCPHGRPVLCELPESELERRFLRRT